MKIKQKSFSYYLFLFVKAALQCEHGHICVHTAEKMCSHAAQTTSECGQGDLKCVLNASWGCSHLYLKLSICDCITQDR